MMERGIWPMWSFPWFEFRPGLRVKKVQGAQDLYEMTWAPNGRALFGFEDEMLTGKIHVVWERIGTHSILPLKASAHPHRGIDL